MCLPMFASWALASWSTPKFATRAARAARSFAGYCAMKSLSLGLFTSQSAISLPSLPSSRAAVIDVRVNSEIHAIRQPRELVLSLQASKLLLGLGLEQQGVLHIAIPPHAERRGLPNDVIRRLDRDEVLVIVGAQVLRILPERHDESVVAVEPVRAFVRERVNVDRIGALEQPARRPLVDRRRVAFGRLVNRVGAHHVRFGRGPLDLLRRAVLPDVVREPAAFLPARRLRAKLPCARRRREVLLGLHESEVVALARIANRLVDPALNTSRRAPRQIEQPALHFRFDFAVLHVTAPYKKSEPRSPEARPIACATRTRLLGLGNVRVAWAVRRPRRDFRRRCMFFARDLADRADQRFDVSSSHRDFRQSC